MSLDYPVQVGIPPTSCYIRSDEPEVLVSFLRFMLDLTNEGAAIFLNAVSKVNPEWITPAKQIIQNCLSLVGAPT